jgi:hypothetical protein
MYAQVMYRYELPADDDETFRLAASRPPITFIDWH